MWDIEATSLKGGPKGNPKESLVSSHSSRDQMSKHHFPWARVKVLARLVPSKGLRAEPISLTVSASKALACDPLSISKAHHSNFDSHDHITFFSSVHRDIVPLIRTL